MKWITLSFTMSLLLIFSGCTQQTPVDLSADNTSEQPQPAATRKPNVLIIGDSISMGYTPHVRAILQARANVSRPDTNCGDTRRGLEQLNQWLGDTKWDVIHFNWGLHDLCYRYRNGDVYRSKDKVNGKVSVPLNEYKQNLDTLVKRLEATGARLIWASTTVVPEGEPGRYAGDEIKYNAAAAEIMKIHGVKTNDLHELTSNMDKLLFAGPGNVHFTQRGYVRIARQVANEIVKTLLYE